jgi:hypothetical protein
VRLSQILTPSRRYLDGLLGATDHPQRRTDAQPSTPTTPRRDCRVVARKSCVAKCAVFNATTMFVRFRHQGRRLQPSLMQTRRVDGKVRSEHIASLGSVDADLSLRERLAFWAKLPGRLDRLGNRVAAAEHGKIYGVLHARIPMVTPDARALYARHRTL